MEKEPFSVLMAEDDEHDLFAARRAWKKHNISNPLYIVNDGEECLDFLYCRGKYKDRDIDCEQRQLSGKWTKKLKERLRKSSTVYNAQRISSAIRLDSKIYARRRWLAQSH